MDTRAQIASIFNEVLAIEVPSHDTDIRATGILDSLTLVTLLVELEQRFEITIPLESIDIERLRTLDSIAALVEEAAIGAQHRAPPSTGPHP